MLINEKIYNVTTDEELFLEREMNPEELKLHKSDIAIAKAQAEAEAAKAAEKAALLEKLGITEDEAKLLLS